MDAFLGGSLSTTLAAGEVIFFEFDYDGTGPINLDTIGSNLPGGTFELDDTELGLFDSAGNLIASNDDAPDAVIGSFSRLDFADGDLAAGTYFLAAGGFNTIFDDGFVATSTSPLAGTLVINGIAIPEPATLGLAAFGGLALLRRRRA